MATATQVSKNVAVREKEWVKLFPKQVTENYTSSVTFMKQLTVVAVSMITYLKNAFPEESYSNETFAGLQLKILNNNDCVDDLAHFVSTALMQAFEAFDKKYIHQLALCFYENSCEPENLIEYHVFEYSYNPDGVVIRINSKNRNSDDSAIKYSLEKVKARTTLFIRSLSMYLLQQSQTELPVSYDVSLRLYYNENAPEGYQAPGFVATDAADPLEPTAGLAVRLGRVDTPYHALVARAYTRGAPPASDEAAPSDNVPILTQVENTDFQGDSGDSAEVRCACNKGDAGDQLLVTCQHCHRRQHAVCFGFCARAPAAHCCAACAAGDPRRAPTDPKLGELEPKRRECLCIFRRTLQLCARETHLSGAALQSALALAARSAARMLRLLQTHGVVPPAADDDLTVQRKINHIRLKMTMHRFFYDVEADTDSVVDRLVAETENIDDPLSAVLRPLEQVSLHNSTLGQVVSPPRAEPGDGDDDTLQQYRQAVMTHEDISEELPLSGSHNPVKNVEKIGKRKSTKRKNDNDEWTPKLRSGAKYKKSRV